MRAPGIFLDRRLEKVLIGIDGKATAPALRRSRGSGQPGHRVGARACRASRRRWWPRRWEPRDMATEITVPTLGESVTSATVARWMKQEGDAVAADEPLVELETDKVTVEVSAPAAGVLTSISAPEGSEVPVGALLGLLDAARRGAAPPRAPPPPAPRCRRPA